MGSNDLVTLIGPARIIEFPRTDVSKTLAESTQGSDVVIAAAPLCSPLFFESMRATTILFHRALLEFIADSTQAVHKPFNWGNCRLSPFGFSPRGDSLTLQCERGQSRTRSRTTWLQFPPTGLTQHEINYRPNSDGLKKNPRAENFSAAEN
jgi:hypothetical protein